MPILFRNPLAALILRAGGLCLILLTIREGELLRHLATAHAAAQASAVELLLAALIFVGMSGGLGLLILGPHLFDRVTLSERWRRRS